MKIIALKVELGGTQEVITSVNEIKKAIEQLRGSLDKTGSSQGIRDTQKALDELTNAAKEYGGEAGKTGGDNKGTEQSYISLNKRIRETKTALEQLIVEKRGDSDEAQVLKNRLTSLSQTQRKYKEEVRQATQAKKESAEADRTLGQRLSAARRELEQLALKQDENSDRARELKQEIGSLTAIQQRLRQETTQLKQEKIAEGSEYRKLVVTVNKLEKEYKELAAAEGRSSRAAREVRRRHNEARKELDKIDGAVGRFQRNVGNYSSALKNVGRNLIAAFGVGTAITVFANVIRDAGRRVVEFDQSTQNLAAILGKSREEITPLVEAAKELGARSAFTASQVADLQIELAKLGFNQQEILDATESIGQFAIATEADVPRAAALAGSALRAFGLEASEASRVASVLAVSTTKSALDFSKLENALSTVAPVAKTFGFEIEETVALLGSLANAGFDASSAGTATRNILLNLADSGGELAQRLGGSVRTFDELIPALIKLREEGVDLNEILGLTSVRTAAAFSQFLEGAESASELRDSITDVEAELAQLADQRLDTVRGGMLQLSSAFEGLILSIEDGQGSIASFVNSVTGNLTLLLQSLTALNEGTRPAIEVTTDAFRGQSAAVKNLQRDVLPLIDRYDELKNKAELSKEEQEELEEIIQRVSIDVPQAAIDWDEYGNAVEIAKDRVIEFVAAQEQLLDADRTEAIQATRDELLKLEVELRRIKKAQEEGGEQSFLRQRGGFLDFSGDDTLLITDETPTNFQQFLKGVKIEEIDPNEEIKRITSDITKLQERLEGFSDGVDEVNALIESLDDLSEATGDVSLDNEELSAKALEVNDEIDEVRETLKGLKEEYIATSDEARKVELDIETRAAEEKIKELRGKVDQFNESEGAKIETEPAENSIKDLQDKVNELRDQYFKSNDEIEKRELRIQIGQFTRQLRTAREQYEDFIKSLTAPPEGSVAFYRQQLQELKKDLERVTDEAERSDLEIKIEVAFNQLEEAEEGLKEFYATLGAAPEGSLDAIQADIRRIKSELSEETDPVLIQQYVTELKIAEDKLEEVNDDIDHFRALQERKAGITFTLETDAGALESFQLPQLDIEPITLEIDPEVVNTTEAIELRVQRIERVRDREITAINEVVAERLSSTQLTEEQREQIIRDSSERIKQIELQSQLDITQERLKNQDLDSNEQAALLRDAAQLRVQLEEEAAERIKEKYFATWKEIADFSTDLISQAAGTIFQIERNRINRIEQNELDSLEERFDKQFEHAQGNADLTERLQEELEEKREEIQIDAAKRRQEILIKEALANQAAAVVKTIANLGFPAAIPVLAAQAVLTGLQIAEIKSQQFKEGGEVFAEGDLINVSDTTSQDVTKLVKVAEFGMRVTDKAVKFQSGGIIQGKPHSLGGVPLTVDGETVIEAEGKEFVVKSTALQDPQVKTYRGTSREILQQINSGSGSVVQGDDIESGSFIVNKTSVGDGQVRTLRGTNIDIVEAINTRDFDRVTDFEQIREVRVLQDGGQVGNFRSPAPATLEAPRGVIQVIEKTVLTQELVKMESQKFLDGLGEMIESKLNNLTSQLTEQVSDAVRVAAAEGTRDGASLGLNDANRRIEREERARQNSQE